MSEAVLSVDILANTSQLTTGLANAGTALNAFSMEEGVAATVTGVLDGTLGALVGTLGILSAAFIGLAGLAGIGFAGFSLFSELQNMSSIAGTAKLLGTTTEEMSKLAFAAKKTGIDLESFTDISKHFNRTLGEALNGSAEAIGKFNSLNIDASRLGALPFEQQVRALADSISKLPTRAQQTAAAMDIFGRSAGDILPLLDRGADGIQRLMEMAEATGNVVSGKAAEDFKTFKRAVSDLKDLFDGLWRQLATAITPALASIGAKLQELQPMFIEVFATIEAYLENWDASFKTAFAHVELAILEFVLAAKDLLLGKFNQIIITVAATAAANLAILAMNMKKTLDNFGNFKFEIHWDSLKTGMGKAWDDAITTMEDKKDELKRLVSVLDKELGDKVGESVKKKLDALARAANAIPALPDVSGQLVKDKEDKSTVKGAGFANFGSIEAANAIARSMRDTNKPEVKLLQQAVTILQKIAEKAPNHEGRVVPAQFAVADMM